MLKNHCEDSNRAKLMTEVYENEGNSGGNDADEARRGFLVG